MSEQSSVVMERSTCCTVGCHRKPVVIHSHAPGSEPVESERAALCFPCRRVLEYARRIPWNDESQNWLDVEALETWIDENDLVVSERYVETDTDHYKRGDQQ